MPEARPSWDETWLAQAEVMARRSRCRGGAGAVAVDYRNQIVQSAYTGPPANYSLTEEEDLVSQSCIGYCKRANRDPSERDLAYLDCPSVHAEINLISFSDRTRIEGGTIYVSTVPCLNCAKALANSGVLRVVWRATAADRHRDPKGAVDYLRRCGIMVDVIP